MCQCKLDCIQEEIKRGLNSGNASYRSGQNLLPSRPLSTNLTTTIYRTIILPVVLYWCETWSLKLREGRRRRVFEKWVLRRTFGPKTTEMLGGWRKLHKEDIRNFVLFAKCN
jgi:hypothetical protein